MGGKVHLVESTLSFSCTKMEEVCGRGFSLVVGRNSHGSDMTQGMYVWSVNVWYDLRYVWDYVCARKVDWSTQLFPGSGKKLA